MSYTENLLRATDFAVYLKGVRGEWIPYPESGKIFSTTTGEFLSTSVIRGYHSISFTLSYGGKRYCSRVTLHRALWVLCRGIPLSLKAEVDHIDKNRDNNVLSNLRLMSNAENSQRKLTWELAEEIRRRYAEGEIQAKLAEEYGVSPTTIWEVLSRRTYRNPPEKMYCRRRI